MSLSDAQSTFKGDVLQAVDAAMGPLVDSIQAEQQAALTQARADVAALTLDVDNLTAQGERDRQTIAADAETVKSLNAQVTAGTAALTQAQADLAKANARIKELEAGQPVQSLLVGSTYPGKDLADWDHLHFYIQGNGTVPAVADDMPFALTYTGYLGGVGWSTNPTNVAKVKAHLAGLPDRADLYVNDFHEPEDNYGRTAAGGAKYLSDAVVFGQQVAAANAGRVHPLQWFQQFQGGSLVGKNNPDDMKAWVAPTADLVSLDVYGPNQVDAAIAFAAEVGKPLCVGEMGPLDNVPHNDDAMLAYAQGAFPKYKAAGVRFVDWFNKQTAGGYLGQYPKTLAYVVSQRA